MILIAVIFLIFFFIFIKNHEKISKLYNLYDSPFSQIKSHKNQVPITGGIFFMLSLILYSSILIYLKENNYVIFDNIYFFRNLRDFIAFNIVALLFFLIGVFDDKYNLSANYRLFFFTFFTYLLITLDNSILINKIEFTNFDFKIYLNQFSLFFTILCFLIFINSLNMIDGINGFASFYVIIFATSILIKVPSIFLFKILIFVMIFFLYLNLKNKSFMGDGGSYLIGFLLSYIVIKLKLYGFLTNENIIILMILPVIELLRVASNRVLMGKHPFVGDQNHIHHKLLKYFSLYKTLLILTFITYTPVVINFFTHMFFLPLILFLVIYVFIIFKFN